MSSHLTDLSSYPEQNNNQNFAENASNKTFLNKSMVSKSESVSTSLTIKTSEGDIVELSTKSFYNFKSLLYNKKGEVYSDAGTITNKTSYREMTLKSGQSFTFSVQGDLNPEELDDIEKIVGQIDNILYDMKTGDMGSAIEKALDMGGYDTISKFSADLSVKKSYSMISEKTVNNITNMEDALLKKAKQPVQQLVNHYFKDLIETEDKKIDPIKAFLEQLQLHLFD